MFALCTIQNMPVQNSTLHLFDLLGSWKIFLMEIGIPFSRDMPLTSSCPNFSWVVKVLWPLKYFTVPSKQITCKMTDQSTVLRISDVTSINLQIKSYEEIVPLTFQRLFFFWDTHKHKECNENFLYSWRKLKEENKSHLKIYPVGIPH